MGACINPHIDDCWIWGERIVQLNLMSDTYLTLVPFEATEPIRYNLPGTYILKQFQMLNIHSLELCPFFLPKKLEFELGIVVSFSSKQTKNFNFFLAPKMV